MKSYNYKRENQFFPRRWKRLKEALFAIAALTLTLASVSSAVSAKSFYHPEIKIVFRLERDGSAEVEETRSFRFDGDFSWAQIERETTGDYGSYRIDFSGVWDLPANTPVRFQKSSGSGIERIKWFYSASNTTRSFLIRYRISDAVQRYSDVAQFYWKAITGSHEYIGKVHITVIPPDASPRLFKVFVHSQAPPGTLNFDDRFDRADIAQGPIGRNISVELRVLLDPNLFPDAAVLSGQTYSGLIENEKKVTEKWRKAQERRIEESRKRAGLMRAAVAVSIVLVIIFLAVFAWFYIRFGREPSVPYDNDYEREPPREIPPCYIPAILTQSGVHSTAMGKAFASSLLEASRLGYMTIHEESKQGLIFSSEHLVYKLTAKGKDLLGGKPVNLGQSERELIPFERDLLEAVFIEAGDGDGATGEDIQKWARGKSGGKTAYFRFVEKHGKQLRTKFESDYFPLDDERSERARKTFILISVLMGALLIFLYFVQIRHPVLMLTGIPLMVAGVFLSIPIARRTEEATIEYKKWKAFERFLTDFSALKDAGPSLLPMWEKYLVYAAALGVADKFLSKLKLAAAESNTPIPVARWYYPASLGVEAAAGIDGIASLDSLSASISNLQSLSSALSTSTSSGGGFSGGGGGGGGGGSCSAG